MRRLGLQRAPRGKAPKLDKPRDGTPEWPKKLTSDAGVIGNAHVSYLDEAVAPDGEDFFGRLSLPEGLEGPPGVDHPSRLVASRLVGSKAHGDGLARSGTFDAQRPVELQGLEGDLGLARHHQGRAGA